MWELIISATLGNGLAHAEKIIKTTKPKNRPSTIAVLETSDGQIYYGQSGLGEPPDAALLKIIRNHEHNFGCAEVNCLNQALRFNPPESLRGARITSLAIRGSASNPDIYFQPPCTNGCAILLESLGITIVR